MTLVKGGFRKFWAIEKSSGRPKYYFGRVMDWNDITIRICTSRNEYIVIDRKDIRKGLDIND